MHKHRDRQKKSLSHLHRIQGQLETLSRYIQGGESCEAISQLTTSIAKSFDALRVRTLEGFILNDLSGGKAITEHQRITLTKLLNLHKK